MIWEKILLHSTIVLCYFVDKFKICHVVWNYIEINTLRIFFHICPIFWVDVQQCPLRSCCVENNQIKFSIRMGEMCVVFRSFVTLIYLERLVQDKICRNTIILRYNFNINTMYMHIVGTNTIWLHKLLLVK